MRLLLGQLYDQRAALHLEQRYVGEVLIPQEHLCAHHLHEAVRFVVRKYPALRGCFTRSEGEWRMDFVAVDAFPVDQALHVVAAAPRGVAWCTGSGQRRSTAHDLSFDRFAQ